MQHYIHFVTCLAIGLFGLSLVMKTVLETLFHDWDAVAELAELWRYWMSDKARLRHERVEDYLMDQESSRRGEEPESIRLIDKRRQQLREVAAVEDRLQRKPRGPIVLTPMPAPRGMVNLTPVAPAPAAAKQAPPSDPFEPFVYPVD